MTSVRTETETVIKRILPYLRRRGFDPEVDIDFETAVKSLDRYNNGYVDLLVTCGRKSPLFLIEAKRSGKKLTTKDRDQAIGYGLAVKVLFVVVTNGKDIQVFNTQTKEPIRWDGRLAAKIPTSAELPGVIKYLKANRNASDVPVSADSTLPFRPGLPLKQLNGLFGRCHNKIRDLEKNEEHAFADFSKILFLRLLEEKADGRDFVLPYSYRFWELAAKPANEADQVQAAITTMLDQIRAVGYGDVLIEPLYLKRPATFLYLVQQLAGVSFEDSGLDTKGAAFEYFVRATLKGKRLGQYFTPRPLVDLMVGLVGREAVVSGIRSGEQVRVLDPACGTGGFLVYLMKQSLEQLDELLAKKKLTKSTHDALAEKVRRGVFHGADANEGVAAAAKMNMIIAGDGHTNILAEDSLSQSAMSWSFDQANCDIVLTNPPFGTSESSSLQAGDLARYPVATTKGQLLFLQRMVLATVPGGHICTVIDEGALNTDSATAVRRWLLQNVELLAVVRLPDETFKPNKINVRSSVLLMRRRADKDVDLGNTYHVAMCELESLGYQGSGEPIRGFDFGALRIDFESVVLNHTAGDRAGTHWRAFDILSTDIGADSACRMDLKYWDPVVRKEVSKLEADGAVSIKDLNTIPTERGKSPSADLYVDKSDGYAVVVKAGSNITRFGELATEGADYIEKVVYDELSDGSKVRKWDILLSSTGDGTLGKVCVYDTDEPAVADGHVTIIRPDPKVIDPLYLCDYLRVGFGKDQIERLYSGSTGLIELTPDHVRRIRVSAPSKLSDQKKRSASLRKLEKVARTGLAAAESDLLKARSAFESA